MRIPATLLASSLLGLTTLCASAADDPDIPSLRVFGGAAMEKGRWRMELLKMQRGGKDSQAAAGLNGMSVCMDSMAQMALESRHRGVDCSTKVLKNLPRLAQVETRCAGSHYRSTITREGPSSFLVDGEGTRGPGDSFTMRVRYIYQGACKAGAGAVALGKESAHCQRARAQMARLSPDKACGSLGGDQRTMCEAQIQQSLARVNAICSQ